MNSMNCTPGFPVSHCLPEFAQTHVHWVSDAIQPSHLRSPTSPVLSLSQHHSLPMSQLFTSGGQSIGASTSASVLPVNIQGWFPLGFTGLISLLSAGNIILIVFGRAIFPEVEKWLNSNKKSVSFSCPEYTERRIWHKFNWEFWWTQIKSDT